MSGAVRRVTDAVLLGWLDDAPARLERYLIRHPEASARLDQLTELSEGQGRHLEACLEPTVDFPERMVRAVTPRPDATASPALLLDMLTLPWRTASLLVDPRRGQGAES
jgi:hypothetical protein